MNASWGVLLKRVSVLLLGWCCSAVAMAEEKRIALVIANSEYITPADRLPGPVRDAITVAKALKAANFTVLEVRNSTVAQMKAAIKQFAGELKRAGPTSIGLVYYAGHGAADRRRGENYLLPVDMPDITNADYGKQGYAVEDLLDQLRSLDQRAAIALVIDACRTPAGASSGAARTLSDPHDPGLGFLVAHSTGQGRPASDSSLYADSFARLIGQPGLALESVFDEVRKEVAAKNHGQLPVHKSGLVEKVCLGGCASGSGAAGKYASNPTLLKIMRGDSERLIAEMERLKASERCKGPYDAMVQLHDSALKAMGQGDPDTAGGTWEQVVQRGTMIAPLLRSVHQSSESLSAMTEETRNSHELRVAKGFYDRHDRDFERRYYPRASKWARTAKLEADLSRMARMRDEASRLAGENRYQEAANLLVDAINFGKELEEEANGNSEKLIRLGYPVVKADSSVRTPAASRIDLLTMPGSPCR